MFTDFARPSRVSEQGALPFRYEKWPENCPLVSSRSRQPLPFNQLQAFERVDRQFSAWGIYFEDAIAIQPTNPRFIPAQQGLVLMPTASKNALKIKLLRPPRSMVLQVRGYQDIHLTALNGEGHCTLCGRTCCHRSSEKAKAPRETVTLDLQRAQVLVLKSYAPFVLESCLL